MADFEKMTIEELLKTVKYWTRTQNFRQINIIEQQILSRFAKLEGKRKALQMFYDAMTDKCIEQEKVIELMAKSLYCNGWYPRWELAEITKHFEKEAEQLLKEKADEN
ncbi:hypothetical protein LCGC14_1303670 [marine sediment metagenome]|uniref:Uncharacterized protein n=1 Tax=marine sediment metagenome TaxID=412755 RepID=A0A0F9KQ30_9ZZZZ